MLFLALPSHKMGGRFRVLRDRRDALEACECKRVVFFVAGAALCESQWQGRANVTSLQISWQAQYLVSVLKSGGSFAKVILFELCKDGFIIMGPDNPTCYQLPGDTTFRYNKT